MNYFAKDLLLHKYALMAVRGLMDACTGSFLCFCSSEICLLVFYSTKIRIMLNFLLPWFLSLDLPLFVFFRGSCYSF